MKGQMAITTTGKADVAQLVISMNFNQITASTSHMTQEWHCQMFAYLPFTKWDKNDHTHKNDQTSNSEWNGATQKHWQPTP